jgi:hypothetical protein
MFKKYGLDRLLRKMGPIVGYLFFLMDCSLLCDAQQSNSMPAAQEVWPEVDAFYKISPLVRLMALGSATRATTYYQDGALGLNADFFALPHLRKDIPEFDPDSTRGYYQWFRAGLKYNRPDPSSKNPASEYTIRTESNTRFYPGWKTLVTLRNRFDFVDKAGDITVKYMPRITWDKGFHTTYLNFDAYLYAEYYFYFDDASNNRLSVSIGANIKVSRLIVFELYYLHQFENQPKVGTLDAIGMKLMFYMPLKKGRSS